MDFTLVAIQQLDRGTSKLFNAALESDAGKGYLEIATVTTSKNRLQSYAWLGDLPSMKEWVDTRQLAQITDYKYDIAKKDWETSFFVTRDDFMFDGLGLVKTKVATLNYAINDHYEEITSDLITANGLCFDGNAFFGAHDIGTGGDAVAYNNTSDYKLTADNVFAVIAKMKKIKKTNGRSMRIKPSMILIAADLEQTAAKIFASAVVGGDTNEAKGLLKVKVMDNMADGTWCVIDNTRPVKPFILQITKKANKIDRLTEEPLRGKKIFYGVDTMDNAGYSYWQLAHFCDGTEVPAA